MTVFLIIMIPVASMLGFVMCALCQVASQADREEEKLFEKRLLELEKEKEETA